MRLPRRRASPAAPSSSTSGIRALDHLLLIPAEALRKRGSTDQAKHSKALGPAFAGMSGGDRRRRVALAISCVPPATRLLSTNWNDSSEAHDESAVAAGNRDGPWR